MALIQEVVDRSSIATLTLTLGSSATAGNSFVVNIVHGKDSSIRYVGTIDGGASEMDLAIGPIESPASGIYISQYYIHNLSGGETGVEINFGGDVDSVGNLQEYSDLVNTAHEDTSSNVGTGATPDAGTVTPVSDDNLIVVGMGNDTNTGFVYDSGPDAGVTRLTAHNSTAGRELESGYLEQTDANPTAVSWGISGGGGDADWAAVAVAYEMENTSPPAPEGDGNFFFMF